MPHMQFFKDLSLSAFTAGFVAVLVMLGTYTPEVFTNLLRAVAVSIGG